MSLAFAFPVIALLMFIAVLAIFPVALYRSVGFAHVFTLAAKDSTNSIVSAV